MFNELKKGTIMKAIELKKAFVEAGDVVLNGADALVESSVLKQLMESCKKRVEAIESDAKQLAEEILAAQGARKGKFEHDGHHYTLDRDEVYDLVGKPQRYTMPEAVLYRQYAKEQREYKDKSAGLTKSMKAIYDQFPTDHPTFEPDDEKTTLKCLD